MSSAVIGVNECAIRAQDDPIWFRRPAGGCDTLLNGLFECIGKVMPAIAICVACIEASVRAEFNPERGYVSLAGVAGPVDEPGFELRGEVESPCVMSTWS